MRCPPPARLCMLAFFVARNLLGPRPRGPRRRDATIHTGSIHHDGRGILTFFLYLSYSDTKTHESYAR